ncbi:MAG: hypothetical protein ACE5Q6_23005 [Dehalococcoidia bacterium]
MHLAFYVVLGHTVGAALLGWIYFRHFPIKRPPIGVFNLLDVVLLLVAIILVPFLYLALPFWVAASILGLAVLGILYITWEPVLPARWMIWVATIALLGADVGANLLFGATSASFFAMNNVVLIISVIGATNLWAQSGMKARDLAVLASGLAVYDFIATSRLTLMDDLISRLATMPLAPQVAWNVGEDFWLGVGLGDLLMATVFPMVMHRAFGRSAGMVAMVLAIGAIGTMLALLDLGILRMTIPAMVVLGPLVVLHYSYCRWRRGPERTTRQYQQADPWRVRFAMKAACSEEPASAQSEEAAKQRLSTV